MLRADRTTRAVAGFVDLLLIISLARLPDVVGFFSAAAYILFLDGFFDRRRIGKKLIGLQVASSDVTGSPVTYRESIIRNVPFAAAYILYFIPYAGWVLVTLMVSVECLVAIGDERGMRIGDLLARTIVVQNTSKAAAEDREREQQPGASISPTTSRGEEH